jgi:tetratricopeptide (TPR) repeat protein
MENVLPAYNDPLFSILIIVGIAFVISVATYGWGVLKRQKENSKLLKFLEKFNSAECALDTSNMAYEKHMFKPLTLLARAFENAGEYHKAISLYLYLIKNTSKDEGKYELMTYLGSTYLRAGFLERSKNIFLKILQHTPRNPKVLKELGIVYEMTQSYDKAKEILEPLNQLGEETSELQGFLAFSKVAHSKQLTPEEKCEKLIAILAGEPRFYRQVMGQLFGLNTAYAWQQFDPSRTLEILDTLWQLPNSQLNFDIIANHTTLATLYYAKGLLSQPPTQRCGIFELDILAIAKERGFEEVDLLFSYLCKKCKRNFPVPFMRCPNCMSIHSIEVKGKLVHATPQTDYSLL